MPHLRVVFFLAIGLSLGALHEFPKCRLILHGHLPLIMKPQGHGRVVYTEEQGHLDLERGESVEAHCYSGIIFENQLNKGRQTIYADGSKDWRCYWDSKIHFRELNSSAWESINSDSVYISCQEPWNQTLYKSSRNLPNCAPYMSYAMGVAVPNVREVVSTGMCYDLDTHKLRFVIYFAYRPSYEQELKKTMRHNLLGVDLSTKLGNLSAHFTAINQDSIRKSLSLKKAEQTLLQPFDFDYVSLLQDTPMQQECAAFSHIFNTMWWRGLRLGNWRFYLNALEERAKSVSYRIYMGTADHMIIPKKLRAKNEAIYNSENKISIKADNSTVDAPEYIWSYVKSLEQSIREEFVVIAYNSPYYRISPIFCRDMCDKIGWLKESEFGLTRLMPTFGLSFCCVPEEVFRFFEHFPFP